MPPLWMTNVTGMHTETCHNGDIQPRLINENNMPHHQRSLELEQKFAWVYLLNLGFYLLPMVLFPYSVLQWVLLGSLMLVFIGVYYAVYQSTPASRPWLIATLFLLACLATPWNPGSVTLFGFVGFFLGFFYRARIAWPLIAGVVGTIFLFHYALNPLWAYFQVYGVFLVVVIGLFGVIERYRQQSVLQRQQSEDEIRQLAATVERERIARDLHDILGHTLSSIILKADLANKQLGKAHYEQAQAQLQELSEIARSSLGKVRESVSGYRHQGLDGELQRLCRQLQDAGFSVRVEGNPPTLKDPQEATLILALTELVTNMVRHSEGPHCHIKFSERGDQIRVEVVDSGNCNQLVEGNGLKGIRERLQALNGHFEYNVGHGCRFELLLPAGNKVAI